jgi:IS5 family transposase
LSRVWFSQKKEKSSNFEERVFQETMEQYQTRVADRCEIGQNCCALRILEAQDDFKQEVSLLETIIQQAGHEVIFYPKFHCELNYIEYYWAALKRYTRDNCKYTFSELENTVLEAMGSVDLKTIRRFAIRSKRWMLAYINGLTEEQRAYAEKVYRSHRREARQISV